MAQVPFDDTEPGISRVMRETGFTFDEVESIFTLPDAVATFGSFVSGARGVVTGAINDVSFNVRNIFDSVRELLLAGSGATVDAMGGLAENIYREVTDYVKASNEVIQANITTLSNDAIQEAKETAEATRDLVHDIEAEVRGGLVTATQGIEDALKTSQDAVLGVVTPALELVQETADSIVEQATGFATALRETIPEIGTQITEGLSGIGDKVTSGFGKAFTGAFELIGADKLLGLFEMFGDVIGKMDAELGGLDTLDVQPGSWDVFASKADVINMWLMSIPFLGGRLSLQYPGEVERIKQNDFANVRPALLGANEAASGEQRGVLTADLAKRIMDRQGLPDEQQDALRELVMLRPGTMEVIDYWRRELMTPEEADQALYRLGWNEGYRDLLREAAYPPPGVGDLITMAVREVFSPEVAERFGQFDEIPDAYMMWAKRIGLNDYWARNYWAAHWSLPSIMQGFEMLHRDVITSEDLDRLFVALDVMPFWRDNIKAISYSPFTRVDVRRMYQQGILDRDGVLRAYKDIGYDEDKAELLTQFTVKYVDGLVKVVKAKERDLSKGDVIGLFNDGVITASETMGYLMQLGYSNDEATVLVRREEIQEERKERRAEIEAIIDQAQIKVITFEQAQDRLSALDLSPTETRKAVASLTRAIAARTRTPSKSDLDTWLELGLLTGAEYESEMEALGYPDKYIALYLEAQQVEVDEDLLAAESRAARKREPRVVTKGQLDQLYIGEIILEEEYTLGLETLGYRNGDIANFLVAANLKLDEKLAAERDRIARGEEAARKERLPNRTLLGKMFLKGIIDVAAYEEGLIRLGFSPDNVELLKRLIVDKQQAETAEAG